MSSRESSSGEKSQSSFSPDCVVLGNQLFTALADSRGEVQSIVKHFLNEIYLQNKQTGEYTLIELVFRCGGYKCNITQEMTRYDYPRLVEIVTKKSPVGGYGVHPLFGKKSKVNASKVSEFISELIYQCKDNLVVYDDYLIPNLAEFLRCAAQTGFNNLRHTATFCAMKLTSALISIEAENQKSLDRNSENLQDALESKQASRIMLVKEKALKKIELYELRQQKIKKTREYLMKKNFRNAYRDMWEPIQLLSIQELEVWVRTAPMHLISHGKFIIQATFDPAVAVRLGAIQVALSGLDVIDEDDDSEYESFFEAALKVLVERILDISEDVAILAIRLVGKIRGRFPSADLSPVDRRGVANMVYAKRQKVAQEAGIVMYNKLQTMNCGSFIMWLARFHARNVRDLPALFRPGTETFLLAALPKNCPELTDWEMMISAALDPGPDSHALAIIIAAAVACAVKGAKAQDSTAAAYIQRQKITEVFVDPLDKILGSCTDIETIKTYLQIIRHMDIGTLCMSKYKLASSKMIRHVPRLALVYSKHFVLAVPSAAALAQLVTEGNEDAIDAVNKVFRFGLTRLEENMGDSPETSSVLENIESSLCLLAAFGAVSPLPQALETRLLEILSKVADDVELSPSQWGQKAQAYAIEALYYDYIWGLMSLTGSRTTTEQKGRYLLHVILIFLESKQQFIDSTKTVICSALDIFCTMEPADCSDNFSELFPILSEYVEKSIFARNIDDSRANITGDKSLLVAFFKLLVQGCIAPELSTVFYKNYPMINSDLQKIVAELHTFFCEQDEFYGPLCAVVLDGLKSTYVDLYSSCNGSDLELCGMVTELADTAEIVCSWLIPNKKAKKRDYEEKAEEIAKMMAERITTCIASPEAMAPFCEVLAPFADKLTDGHKKKMLKLVIKGFGGKSSVSVKKLVNRLRMKNTELEKLNGKSTANNAEEAPPSPIEHERLDRLHYTPLQLHSSKIPGDNRRPITSSLAKSSGRILDQSSPIMTSGSPKIQLSQPENSDNSDQVLSNSDPALSPAESSDSMLEMQPTLLESHHMPQQRPLKRKPFGHSTLIEKQPAGKSVRKPVPNFDPMGSSSPIELVPGSSSSKTAQAVALKNTERGKTKRRYVPLPIQTLVQKVEKKTRATHEQSVNSIHEYPACNLEKKYSPRMVIAAEDCTGTSDFCEAGNNSVGGKPAEISNGEESFNDYLPCYAIPDQSVASARVTPPKTPRHRSVDVSDRTVDTSVSFENAPTQKRSSRSRSLSQAVNTLPVVDGEWSITANAGSFDKNSVQSSTVPQPKKERDLESKSSAGSSGLANTLLPRAYCVIDEHGLSSASHQGSGSSKEVVEDKQNAVGNFPTVEDREGICSSQPCLARSSDTLSFNKGEAAILNEHHRDNYGSEDFIPSSQLCSSSSDKESLPVNTSGLVELMTEDESDGNVYMQKTSGNSSFTNNLANSPEEAIVALSPELSGMGDTLANAGSSSEVDPVGIQNGQAAENSDDANSFTCSPAEAIITFSPEIVGIGGMVVKTDSDGEDEVESNNFYSATESDCELHSSESKAPDSGQKALECLAGPSQEIFHKLSGSMYLDCKESEDQALLKSEEQGSPQTVVPSSCDIGSIHKLIGGGNSQKPLVPLASLPGSVVDEIKWSVPITSPSVISTPRSMMSSIESGGSKEYLVPEAESPVTSLQRLLICNEESDASMMSPTFKALSSITSSPNSLMSDTESDRFVKSQVSGAQSLVTGPPNSLISVIDNDGSMKSRVSAAPSSVTSPPNSLMSDVDSDGSVKSQVSAAPSSVISPPNSLMSDLKSDGSVKSRVSAAPSSVTSPPNSLMSDVDSDGSVKSRVSAAPSSVTSPPNSLMSDVDSDGSVKSQVSAAPSSVTSPPNSLMSDVDSDGSVKSRVSAAPSSVTSPPNSLMSDVDSDGSVKSQVSAAPSSVISPPNSLMSDLKSDGSVKSRVSAAPSSVTSPPNSLISDVDSDGSVKSQVSAAPSSVSSPPNSLMSDVDSDGSVKSQVSAAPSSVTSPPNSLMGYVDSDGSVKSQVSAAPSSVISPPNSLMSDVDSDGSVKSQMSAAPSSVTSPPNSLMGCVESDGYVKSKVSGTQSLVSSPPYSLMGDIENESDGSQK